MSGIGFSVFCKPSIHFSSLLFISIKEKGLIHNDFPKCFGHKGSIICSNELSFSLEQAIRSLLVLSKEVIIWIVSKSMNIRFTIVSITNDLRASFDKTTFKNGYNHAMKI